MIGRSKGLFRKQYIQMAAFEAQKSNRTGHFMNEMPVNKKYIGPISDLPDHMRIPYFVK
jgi:hypothetical protein